MVEDDEDGDDDDEAPSRRKGLKNQAILPMDMATWRELIDTYDIKEPMIEHRQESGLNAGPGTQGWYS